LKADRHAEVIVKSSGTRGAERSFIATTLSRLAVAAKFPFWVHPHILHADIIWRTMGRDTRALQRYLGHKNIMHTARYTELSPERFNDD
jgi:site-specific recombinase XerD